MRSKPHHKTTIMISTAREEQSVGHRDSIAPVLTSITLTQQAIPQCRTADAAYVSKVAFGASSYPIHSVGPPHVIARVQHRMSMRTASTCIFTHFFAPRERVFS